MTYDHETYKKDLLDPEFPHIKDLKRFRNFYNELGKSQDQLDQYFNKDTEKRMKIVIPKGKILELGCHWGFNLINWARQGFECVGVDCSESLLEFGKKQIAKEPPEVQQKIKLINCMIEDFMADEKYDTIVLTETLEHVIDPLTILKKAKEYLKKDGYIYISAPAIRCGNASHVRGITSKEIMDLVQEIGLIVEYGIWGMAYIMEDGTYVPLTMVAVRHNAPPIS